MSLNQSELRSFFYGTLLGDSYIHSGTFYSKQISKDLIYFKKKIIETYLPDARVKVLEYDGYTDKNGVNHQPYYVLSAASSEYIKKLEKIFYPEGKKICPKNVINKLTDIGLAMWYADDGTTILVGLNTTTLSAKSRRVQFCTDSFTLEEHNSIIIPEMKELGFINSTVIDRARKGQVRLQISTHEGQNLFCKITPYFYNYFPSLLYKMDMGYRNKSLTYRRYVSEDYEQLYYNMSAHPLFIDRLKNR